MVFPIILSAATLWQDLGRSGFSNASDHLLENAYYILTPGGEVPLNKLTEFSELIDSLGAIPPWWPHR